MKYSFLVLFTFLSFASIAQEDLSYLDSLGAKFKEPNRVDKKLLWGFSYHSGWSTLAGLDSFEVFTKPGVGAGVHVNYFPLDWLGFSVGASHQMRGTGIITRDYEQSLGARDSTYRCRFRNNTFNIPIEVIVRSPFKIFNKTTRISAVLGITPSKIFMAKRIFLSVEDGFHDVTSLKSNYISGWDTPFRFGGGFDFNAGNNALFRVHFFAEYGMKNMYFNPSLNTTSGKNKAFGFEFSVLF